jgi:hypothetical protein
LVRDERLTYSVWRAPPPERPIGFAGQRKLRCPGQRDSWSRKRRAVGKARPFGASAKPGFVVASLRRAAYDDRTLSGSRCVLRQLVADDLAALHDELDVLKLGDIRQRIA